MTEVCFGAVGSARAKLVHFELFRAFSSFYERTPRLTRQRPRGMPSVCVGVCCVCARTHRLSRKVWRWRHWSATRLQRRGSWWRSQTTPSALLIPPPPPRVLRAPCQSLAPPRRRSHRARWSFTCGRSSSSTAPYSSHGTSSPASVLPRPHHPHPHPHLGLAPAGCPPSLCARVRIFVMSSCHRSP